MSSMVDSAKGSGQRGPRTAHRGVNLDMIIMVEPDRGCPDISESCLECPLDQCLWDYPHRERAEVKRLAIQARIDRKS
jgi:hypothetical protein